MRERTIGDLIYRSRVERNITQKQLCDGLCSVQTLSKIESGERMPELFLLEYLLQRLGLSSDDLEIVLFEDEFQEIERQDRIVELIYKDAYVEVEEILEKEYGACITGIKAQYYNQMKAVIASANGNHIESICYIEKALKCTGEGIGSIEEKSKRYSTKELELMCMMSQEYVYKGDDKQAKYILEKLIEYVDKNAIQEKELVKTYPKISFCLAHMTGDVRSQVENVNRCEKAFEMLVNCDSLIFLPEIMSLLIEYYQEMKLSNKVMRLQKQLQSLLELCRIYEIMPYMTGTPFGWFEESGRKEFLLGEEMIRGGREAQNISRGDLVEGIYEDLETLIRIENGNQNPSYKKYAQIMERLGRPTQKYIGPPLWDEDLILIAKEKITNYLIKHEYEDAREEIEKLKLLVEENDYLNQQYIDRQEAYLEFKIAHIDVDTFEERIHTVLKRTYSEQIDTIIRIPTLEECYIFNYLILAYRKKGLKKEALSLYEKLLECYKQSKIKEKYHYRTITVLHRNYLTLLEEVNGGENALKVSKEVMQYELHTRRGKGLDYICTEIMCIYEKMEMEDAEKKKQVEKYLRLAFYLSDLFLRKNNNSIIDNYYKSHIDANVRWYL